MVLLAGIVQVSKVSEDSVWFTLDVGQTQWVPCTAKEPELQEKLKGIYRGDFVQLRAILHPWSKKTGETWTRGMEVLITEVKTLVKGNGAAPKENSANALPF